MNRILKKTNLIVIKTNEIHNNKDHQYLIVLHRQDEVICWPQMVVM